MHGLLPAYLHVPLRRRHQILMPIRNDQLSYVMEAFLEWVVLLWMLSRQTAFLWLNESNLGTCLSSTPILWTPPKNMKSTCSQRAGRRVNTSALPALLEHPYETSIHPEGF